MIEILNIQDTKEYKGGELIYGYYDILAKLPDNATNGDMMKAMFPNAKIVNNGVWGISFDNCTIIYFNKEWWNAPYLKEKINDKD